MEKTARKITHWLGTPTSIAVHSTFFVIMLLWCWFDKANREQILLFLTMIVSLEAIYQMLFLQMTVNLQATQLKEVQVAMAEVQDSVEEVQGSVAEVQESVEEVQGSVEEVKEMAEEEAEPREGIEPPLQPVQQS